MHTAQHSVHPTGGSLRVFRQFAWLGVGSGKVALSRLTHQRVTQAVGRLTLSCLLGKNKARPTKTLLCKPSFSDTFSEGLSQIDNSLQLFLRRKRRVTVPLLPQARWLWEVWHLFFRPSHDLLAIASFSRISELPLNC